MGALQTFGIARDRGREIDREDTAAKTANIHAAGLELALRQQNELSEIIKAAAKQHFSHHQDTPVAAAAAAAPAAIAGGGGVSHAPVENPGMGDSPEIGGTYGFKFANGGMIPAAASGREGKFDGVPDWSKWDGTVGGLPTMYKMTLHSETGVNPDDPDFMGKLGHLVARHGQEQQQQAAFANGGMVGGPLFPGFANGTPDGPIRAGMGAQIGADMSQRVAPQPTPQATSQGNFFNGAARDPNKAGLEEALRRRAEEMKKNGAVRRADGGAIAAPGPLEGPGTGTSDSIPAMIDGVQPAALSKGEMVIPADVVAAKGSEFFTRLIEKYHTEVDNGSA